MRIDLERALTDIAATAQSAAEPVPIDRLLGRLHLRRAARQATTGVVSVGAVAAAALGGVQLGQATTTAGPALEDWTEPACGDPVELFGPSADLELTGGPAVPELPAGGRLVVNLMLRNHGDAVVDLLDADGPMLYVLKDGVVVNDAWNRSWGESGRDTVDAGDVHAYFYDLDLLPCDREPGETLPPGQYELVAVQTYRDRESAEASGALPAPYQVISAGPWPLTITGEALDPAARIESQLQELIATATPGNFPECASLLPTDEQPVTLDLSLDRTRYGLDEEMTGRATLRGPEVGIVNLSAPEVAALVVTRDGVVVSGQVIDRPGPADLALDAGTDITLPALGGTYACQSPTDGDILDALPPGSYQVYASLRATIAAGTDLAGYQGGDVVTLHSEPVAVTIE